MLNSGWFWKATYSIVVVCVIPLFSLLFFKFIFSRFLFVFCSTKSNFKGLVFAFSFFLLEFATKKNTKKSLVLKAKLFSRSVLYENKLPSICEGPWDLYIDIINILNFFIFTRCLFKSWLNSWNLINRPGADKSSSFNWMSHGLQNANQ